MRLSDLFQRTCSCSQQAQLKHHNHCGQPAETPPAYQEGQVSSDDKLSAHGSLPSAPVPAQPAHPPSRHCSTLAPQPACRQQFHTHLTSACWSHVHSRPFHLLAYPFSSLPHSSAFLQRSSETHLHFDPNLAYFSSTNHFESTDGPCHIFGPPHHCYIYPRIHLLLYFGPSPDKSAYRRYDGFSGICRHRMAWLHEPRCVHPFATVNHY